MIIRLLLILLSILLCGCQDHPDTPLTAAAASNDTARIAELVEQGADLQAVDGTCQTALQWAARMGTDRAVSALLDAGADVDHKGRRGWTALITAIHKGHASTVALLLERGADPTIASDHGATPLSMAFHDGKEDIVRLLLAADPELRLPEGFVTDVSIALACLRGQSEMAELVADP